MTTPELKTKAQLHTIEAVMKRLSVGRTTVFELIAAGTLRSVKLGKRRLVPESAIADFIAALESAHGGAA